jgi:hypothetical protein
MSSFKLTESDIDKPIALANALPNGKSNISPYDGEEEPHPYSSPKKTLYYLDLAKDKSSKDIINSLISITEIFLDNLPKSESVNTDYNVIVIAHGNDEEM